jgi:hypothetical protein
MISDLQPPLRQRLAALEAALRNALLLGDNLPPHILADLAGQVAGLAAGPGAECARIAPLERQACLATLGRIRQVHDQLACRLRQQQAETATQLARLRNGRRGLKAYRAR